MAPFTCRCVRACPLQVSQVSRAAHLGPAGMDLQVVPHARASHLSSSSSKEDNACADCLACVGAWVLSAQEGQSLYRSPRDLIRMIAQYMLEEMSRCVAR